MLTRPSICGSKDRNIESRNTEISEIDDDDVDSPLSRGMTEWESQRMTEFLEI